MILLFGSIFEQDKERADLTDLWLRFHGQINPQCEIFLVDSRSPYQPSPPARNPVLRNGRKHRYFNFVDNVGHPSRGGRDGWGRAFCWGLANAITRKADYVAFVEGDSLFRPPIVEVVNEMLSNGVVAASCRCSINRDWPETGVMLFRVSWLKTTNFIRRYAWENRPVGTKPEILIKGLVGPNLTLLPWRACRDDYHQLTPHNVLDFDWISHTKPECYRAFAG